MLTKNLDQILQELRGKKGEGSQNSENGICLNTKRLDCKTQICHLGGRCNIYKWDFFSDNYEQGDNLITVEHT